MPPNVWARAAQGNVLHYWIGENETLCGYLMLVQAVQRRPAKRPIRKCSDCLRKYHRLLKAPVYNVGSS